MTSGRAHDRPTGVRRLRTAIAVAAAGLVAACSFAAPPVRYFEVRPPAPERQQGKLLPSIMIPDFSCVAAYDNLRLTMRKSPVEVVTTRTLQWSTVPGRMIAQGFRLYMEGTGRFTSVRRDIKPKPPYTIEGQVQVIELNEVPSLSARLAIHLNIRRNADDAVIAEDFIDESLAAKGSDPADGVTALRTLEEQILSRVSVWVIGVIEADLRGAPLPPPPSAK